MTQSNQGISISGGVFSNNQMAAGENAQAIQNNVLAQGHLSSKEEVAQAIADLLKMLETYGDRIPDKEQVTQVVQQVAEETKKDQPNKITLKGLLSALKESLGSVVEIAEKVTVLQKVIALMMGLPAL